MAFLASGEDPNFGLYSNQVRERALRSIISAQDAKTGFIGQQHVPPRLRHARAGRGLRRRRRAQRSGPDGKAPPVDRPGPGAGRPRGDHLAEEEPASGPGGTRPTRPTPTPRSAARSLVGLLAARNAGIEVPDESIDKAISYYTKMTSASGQVAYSAASAASTSRSPASRSPRWSTPSPAARTCPQYKATLGYLTQRSSSSPRMALSGIRPLLPGPGPVPGRRRGLGEVEQAAGPPAQAGAERPTAASRASSGPRSARRCRSWPWR